jgi:hypothetical protein
MKKLEEITLEDFQQFVKQSAEGKHTSVAPLGMAGDNLYLHKIENRVQEVSIRLYCGIPELLITNNSKGFLFYGRFDVRLGLDFLALQYFNIFELLKSQIPLDSSEPIKLNVIDSPHHTVGFAMLDAFKKKGGVA